jgi:hypothetical protein
MLSHLKYTSTYLHGDCFVCTNFALCPEMQISSHGTHDDFTFLVPNSKTQEQNWKKRSNLPMAHYCMATPPDSGMAGGTLSLEIVQSLHTLKLSVKSGD